MNGTPVYLIAAIAVLVAVAGAVGFPASAPSVPGDEHAQAGPQDLHVVRLIKVGPRSARVLLDGEDLGELSLSEEGDFSGWAIGRLRNSARRISLGKVEIHPDAGLPEDLAPGVQRMLYGGGVLISTLVLPEQGAPALPEAEEPATSGH